MKLIVLLTLFLLFAVVGGRPQEYLFHGPWMESNRGVDANGVVEYVLCMLVTLLIVMIGVMVCLCRNSCRCRNEEEGIQEPEKSTIPEGKVEKKGFGKNFSAEGPSKGGICNFSANNQLVINVPEDPSHPVITLTKASIRRNEDL
ncbi:hypothetical protein FO519_001062 [Halicephalobus sp. NKZ332]|nr:hypothetical protein FO519_001062 [Halicephalobus sp. NKZ332]